LPINDTVICIVHSNPSNPHMNVLQ